MSGDYGEADFGQDGQKLHCFQLEDGTIHNVLTVTDGRRTCKYSDLTSCPRGFHMWVPVSTLESRAPTALRRGKKDKPLSLDAMIHPLAICSLPPRHPQSPPDEIEVAWDALSNTYVCLFDGACRLALEATSSGPPRGAPLTTHQVE